MPGFGTVQAGKKATGRNGNGASRCRTHSDQKTRREIELQAVSVGIDIKASNPSTTRTGTFVFTLSPDLAVQEDGRLGKLVKLGTTKKRCQP